MPSRCRKKNLFKNTLPNQKIEYYQCPQCNLYGAIVTDNLWVVCGFKWCKKSFRLIDHKVSKEEHDRIWELNTALRMTKSQK